MITRIHFLKSRFRRRWRRRRERAYWSTVLWLKTSRAGKREEATLNRVAGFLHTAHSSPRLRV